MHSCLHGPPTFTVAVFLVKSLTQAAGRVGAQLLFPLSYLTHNGGNLPLYKTPALNSSKNRESTVMAGQHSILAKIQRLLPGRKAGDQDDPPLRLPKETFPSGIKLLYCPKDSAIEYVLSPDWKTLANMPLPASSSSTA